MHFMLLILNKMISTCEYILNLIHIYIYKYIHKYIYIKSIKYM